MKKICLLLFAWLIASIAALANVVIFDPAVDMAAVVTEPPFILEKDGITVTISAGMVNNGSQYRVYKGATITICSSMCDITNIEFQCTAQDDEKYGPGNFVVNTGSYSWEGYVGEWQGKAMCVTFTAEKNQVRITKIIVTYDCDGIVSKPVISPASGTYYQPIEVSITCPNNDATIHYTTNGTDPTAASPQYSFPFTVNNDVTIKAISVLDDEMSDVATASYEFVEASQINNLADALQAPDGTTIFFPNPLIALAQHGPRLFVKDETAYALIYGNSNQTYTNGDIIPGGFYFTKSFYAGEPEFMDPQGFKPATEHVVVDPEEIEDLLGHDLFGHYVVLHNVTIIKEDNQYFAVDANGNRYPIYFGSMGVSAPTDLSETYDLYAIVGSYGNENTIYQLLPVKLVRSLPITLCDMFNYPDNEPITFDHEAYVIYQYNRYLYLMDECGYGVVYGDVGQTYNMGDVIPTGWGGTKTTWNGEPEIKDPTGFQPASRHENLTPMLITIPQAGHLLWAHYVELRNVYIDQENMLIRDQEGNTIPYYPQLPYQVDPTRTYDILAIITSYKRTETIYRLFIISTSYIIPPPPEPCCLTDLYEDYNKGQTVKFACPLTVIYHNSPYLYVKDSCGNYGLIYGNGVGGPFQNGDQIIGNASWTTYQDTYQLSAPDEWEVIGRTDTIEPVEMFIEELSLDMVHWYIRLKDVHISFDDYSPCAVDETGSLTIFDRFNVEVIDELPIVYHPCDVNWDHEVNIADVNALIDVILNGVPSRNTLGLSPDDVDPEKTYDVDGFLTVYKSQLEIYPVRIANKGASDPIIPTHDRYDVNGDGEINIADVNSILDIILGN